MKKSIQIRIDEILINEMRTDGWLNQERKKILETQLLREGYEPAEIYGAIRHYDGLD